MNPILEQCDYVGQLSAVAIRMAEKSVGFAKEGSLLNKKSDDH